MDSENSKSNNWFKKKWAQFKEFWSSEWFDPHKSFLKLKSFWWPFTVIAIAFGLLLWKVVTDQELEWGLDATLEQWYEWFKIPFWVLALLIPVIGLFNSNHKSEQARAAMELTRSQNNFANYYKHIEEFSKYVDTIVGTQTDPATFVHSRSLHSLIFPSSFDLNYRVNTSTEEYLENFLNNYISIANELNGSSVERVIELLLILETHRNLLCLKFDYSFGCFPSVDENRAIHLITSESVSGELVVHVINGQIRDYFDYVARFPYLLHRICMFDRTYLARSKTISNKFKAIGKIVVFMMAGKVERGEVAELPRIDWTQVNTVEGETTQHLYD